MTSIHPTSTRGDHDPARRREQLVAEAVVAGYIREISGPGRHSGSSTPTRRPAELRLPSRRSLGPSRLAEAA